MFAAGLFFAFGDEHVEAGDDLASGVGGVDDFVDVTTFGSDVRVGVLLDVLVDKFVLASGAFCVGAEFAELSPVHDLDGALRAHHRQFSGWPREGQVGADRL